LPTTDAIKQLANQELSKRAYMSRDVLARGNVMPTADRGAFGVTGALTDYGTGMLDAGSSALGYMLDTSLADMGRDAARFGGAMVEGMVEDPLMTAVDFIPGAGLAMGAYEAEQLRGQALEAERAGQFDLAQSLRSQAGAIAAMSMIPGGRTARRGARMDMSPDQSSMRELFGDIPEVTRDTKLLKRVGDVDSVNQMQVEMSAPEFNRINLLSAEDLIDRPWVSMMADTSRSALENVTSINGVPVNAVMEGGRYYGAQSRNRARNSAWGSAEGAVSGIENRAARAQALSGRPVIAIPYGMAAPSPDFATMTTDIMVPYARQMMSRSDKKLLDKRIREGTGKVPGLPEWPGMDSAKAMEFLDNAGGKRKLVTNALDEFRDAGSLNLSQARAIITDPDQFNPNVGDIGSVYELDLGQSRRPAFHKTYSTDVHGRILGGLNSGFNIMELNPITGPKGFELDFNQEMARRGNAAIPGGKVSSAAGKVLMAGTHGVIDQPMADEMIRRGIVRP